MIKNLTALRFVFVLLVFMNHFLCAMVPRLFDYGGECGVAFFFVLSGFVLSVGYGLKVGEGSFSTRRFFLRHLKKLYPLHFLTLAAMLALDGRLGLAPKAGPMLAHLLLVQSWIPADAYLFYGNGVSWFLCDVLFFYLVFAALFRRLMAARRSALLCTGAVVLLAYVALLVVLPRQYVNCFLYANPLLRSLDFMLGILTYRLYRHLAASGRTALLSRLSTAQMTALELAVVAVFVLLAVVYEQSDVAWRSVILFWPFIPAAILFFTLADKHRGLLTRLLHTRPMLSLGGISFEFYMLHLLVFRLVLHVAIRFLPDYNAMTGAAQILSSPRYLALLAADLLLSIACAYAAKRGLAILTRKL